MANYFAAYKLIGAAMDKRKSHEGKMSLELMFWFMVGFTFGCLVFKPNEEPTDEQ